MPDAATLVKLSDDAHFPGSTLADANWLVPVFEFPPAPEVHPHRLGLSCGSLRLRQEVRSGYRARPGFPIQSPQALE
jgi:hypothetical protein